MRTLIIWLCLTTACFAADWYVWNGAGGNGSGDSWDNAYDSIIALDDDKVVQQDDQVFVASDHQEHLIDSKEQGGAWWLRFGNLNYDSPMIMSVNRQSMEPEVMRDAGGYISYDHILIMSAEARWGCMFFVVDTRGRESANSTGAAAAIRIHDGDFFQCDFDSEQGPFFIGDAYPNADDHSRVRLEECCLMMTGTSEAYNFQTRQPGRRVTSVNSIWRSSNTRDVPFYVVKDGGTVVIHGGQLFMNSGEIAFSGDGNYMSVLGVNTSHELTVSDYGTLNVFEDN